MAPRLFNLRFRPQWEELAVVRRAVVDFLKKEQVDGEAIDAMAMVGCELSENAIKYGTVATPEERITLTITLTPGDVTVEVSNRISSKDDGNLHHLDRMVQWIRGYHDPFEAYLQRLRELSSQAPDNTESRLGLVRIAYEGQSVLDFYVNDDDILAVSAIRRLAAPAGGSA